MPVVMHERGTQDNGPDTGINLRYCVKKALEGTAGCDILAADGAESLAAYGFLCLVAHGAGLLTPTPNEGELFLKMLAAEY